MRAAEPISVTRRILPWVWILGLFVIGFFRDGIDGWSVSLLGIYAVLAGAFALVEIRLRPPMLNYGRLALISVATGLLFIGMPAAAGGAFLFGAISWTVVTVLGLIWVVYYERTEPR